MRSWTIIDAVLDHIQPIAENMREADKNEVWASGRHSPDEALRCCLDRAELAWTCIVDDSPAFMWGVSRIGSLVSMRGAPWLLGTDDIYKVRRDFLRLSRPYVDMMQDLFPALANYVHTANTLSIRWLKWCGFTLEPEPIKINGEDFFYFWRGSNV